MQKTKTKEDGEQIYYSIETVSDDGENNLNVSD